MKYGRRLGFTLIELMITLGLIALLAALLLPVVGGARGQMNIIACQNNMRQLMLSVAQYSMDSKGQLPFCNWNQGGVTDTTVYGHGWLFSANSTWNQSQPPANGMNSGVLWRYNHAAAIYHCPVDLQGSELWTGTHWLTSYTMNGSQCNFLAPHVNWIGRTLPSITHPADDVLIWEANDTLWNDGASFPYEAGVTDHHKGGGNVGCLDGHVEWWSPNQFTYEASLGSVAHHGGRLYW